MHFSSNVMQVLKKFIHYRATTLSTHGISTLQVFDGCSQVVDGHVQVIVLQEPDCDESSEGFQIAFLTSVSRSMLRFFISL